jgi:hypothetical protein
VDRGSPSGRVGPSGVLISLSERFKRRARISAQAAFVVGDLLNFWL